jgi:hypothetical protein
MECSLLPLHVAAPRDERRGAWIRKEAGIQSLKGLVELGLPEEFLALRDGASDYVCARQCFPGFGEQIRHLGLVRKLAVRRVQTSYRLAEELERIVAPWSCRGDSHFGIGCRDGLAFPDANLGNCAHGV